MTEASLTQGWAWPGASKKAHYFRAGDIRSLCMAWMFSGPREDHTHESLDNCAKCRKLREKSKLS